MSRDLRICMIFIAAEGDPFTGLRRIDDEIRAGAVVAGPLPRWPARRMCG